MTVIAGVLAVRVVHHVGVLAVVEAVFHGTTLGVVSAATRDVLSALPLPLRVLTTGVALANLPVRERVTGASLLPVRVRVTRDPMNPMTPVRGRSSGRGSPTPGELVTP